MAELRIQPRSVGSTVHSLSHFNKLPVLEWSQIAFSGVEDALRNDLECRQIRCRQRCCLLPVLWQSKLEKATDGLSLEFQFSSVAHLCPAICNPMDCSTPGLPAHHQFLECTQTHVHWVSGTIQPSHPLSSTSPPTFNFYQHQGLFNWVSSSHLVAKVLEFQLQHQSFQWIFRTDFL